MFCKCAGRLGGLGARPHKQMHPMWLLHLPYKSPSVLPLGCSRALLPTAPSHAQLQQAAASYLYINSGAQLLLPLQWGGSRTWMVGAAALRAGSATSLATLTPALTTGAATSTADLTTGATCGMGGKSQYPCH